MDFREGVSLVDVVVGEYVDLLLQDLLLLGRDSVDSQRVSSLDLRDDILYLLANALDVRLDRVWFQEFGVDALTTMDIGVRGIPARPVFYW